MPCAATVLADAFAASRTADLTIFDRRPLRCSTGGADGRTGAAEGALDGEPEAREGWALRDGSAAGGIGYMKTGAWIGSGTEPTCAPLNCAPFSWATLACAARICAVLNSAPNCCCCGRGRG